MTRTRLLVVDDEESIRELLAASLRYAGFDVTTAGSGGDALRAAERDDPELVLLDVMLPDIDGFEVVRRLRGGARRVPVLFLTARDATADKVTGLTLGGDDYVTKPFSLEEVVARVHAVLRRAGSAPGSDRDILRYADLELDTDAHLVHRAGTPVQLSPTEFKLLHYLMRNANRVVSKQQILDQVWNYAFTGSDGVVESYISYLRRKVDYVDPRLIHTVRGLGYVLREQPG
ncbi:response regulator transcription factor [Actinokineospora xionganensis]|uniref:Response regulator transcription factor n=1 Tax=Actinokineospora xionganensis TaxID=2684470 RepID=A0ABR7LCG7_9PSEU|nr:response regulator transcription factor [Actinokineospora xionganensis]MBC6450252.1 response regulator transcription factor [Actinokineospora xionganensis]